MSNNDEYINFDTALDYLCRVENPSVRCNLGNQEGTYLKTLAETGVVRTIDVGHTLYNWSDLVIFLMNQESHSCTQ